MSIARLFRDCRGTTAVEFALLAPAFFMLMSAVIEGGLLLWTQIGLQHGAQAASRCASVNQTLCGTSANVQTYAAQQSLGLNVAPSTFTYTVTACGNQVSANYNFVFFLGYFMNRPVLTLSAQSCFPT